MALVFFDDDKIMVVYLGSAEPIGAYMAGVAGTFDRDASDAELLAALRVAWEFERVNDSAKRAVLTDAEVEASWSPVCDAFDVDFYDKAPNIPANSSYGWIAFSASEWLPRQKHRRYKTQTRTRISIDTPDGEIAAAMRAAMASTHS